MSGGIEIALIATIAKISPEAIPAIFACTVILSSDRMSKRFIGA
jgi:hypothetical protein